MALTILTEMSPLTGVTWHVGDGKPLPYYDVHHVISIQADGDELEYITKVMFQGFPCYPKGPVVRFFGDQAKTIVGNLTNIK